MPNSTDRKRRQKREAVQGAVFFAAMRIAAVMILLWTISLSAQHLWLQVLLGLVALAIGVPVLFVGAALRQRLQEIEGGESDAAAQY